MKKSTKIIIVVIATLVAASSIVFYVWTQQTYKATDELKTLVSQRNIQQKEDWLIFKSPTKTDIGLILYPGAKVDTFAYSYIGKKISEANYDVIIPHMAFNLAIFSTTKAEDIMKAYPNIKGWVVGGHSLGGVAAADFVYKHPKDVLGLLLLASYPSSNVDFTNETLPTLSIYAENDKVTTPKSIIKNQHYLSTNAILHEIKGGNHAGFGMYGPQKDDGRATITPLEQQDHVINQTIQWLDKISGRTE